MQTLDLKRIVDLHPTKDSKELRSPAAVTSSLQLVLAPAVKDTEWAQVPRPNGRHVGSVGGGIIEAFRTHKRAFVPDSCREWSQRAASWDVSVPSVSRAESHRLKISDGLAELPRLAESSRFITLKTDVPMRGVAAQAVFNHLAKNDISSLILQGPWDNAAIRELMRSPLILRLEHLSLLGTRIGPDGFDRLLAGTINDGKQVSALSSIKIVGAPLGFDGALVLLGIRQLTPRLRHIHLTDCGLHAGAVAIIAESPALATLESFSLGRANEDALDEDSVITLSGAHQFCNVLLNEDLCFRTAHEERYFYAHNLIAWERRKGRIEFDEKYLTPDVQLLWNDLRAGKLTALTPLPDALREAGCESTRILETCSCVGILHDITPEKLIALGVLFGAFEGRNVLDSWMAAIQTIFQYRRDSVTGEITLERPAGFSVVDSVRAIDVLYRAATLQVEQVAPLMAEGDATYWQRLELLEQMPHNKTKREMSSRISVTIFGGEDGDHAPWIGTRWQQDNRLGGRGSFRLKFASELDAVLCYAVGRFLQIGAPLPGEHLLPAPGVRIENGIILSEHGGLHVVNESDGYVAGCVLSPWSEES